MELLEARALAVPPELAQGALDGTSHTARARVHPSSRFRGRVFAAADAEAQAYGVTFPLRDDLSAEEVLHELGELVLTDHLFRIFVPREQACPPRVAEDFFLGERHLVGDLHLPDLHLLAAETIEVLGHQDALELLETLLPPFLFLHLPSLADTAGCTAFSTLDFAQKIKKSMA